MATQPVELLYAASLKEIARLQSVNAELLAALQELHYAAPIATNCADFHHKTAQRHALGAECKPAADYVAALDKARAAIRLATPAPSTQEGQ